MKYAPQLLTLCIAFAFAACNSSASDESATTDSLSPETQQLIPGNDSVPPAGTITAPVVNPTTPATGALNPEHGQPGHRCDIGVGQPLNSKPAETTPTITPTQSVNPQPVTINPAPKVNTPGTGAVNPAHGQPGHRCDISVGAPLDSKPEAKPSATIIQPEKSLPNTPLLPAPAVKTETVTAPGMNPEHGKPGHRCDIPVGTALNSKPAQ